MPCMLALTMVPRYLPQAAVSAGLVGLVTGATAVVGAAALSSSPELPQALRATTVMAREAAKMSLRMVVTPVWIFQAWLDAGDAPRQRWRIACCTAGCTKPEMSPPRRPISRTSEEEMKLYCSAGVRNNVSACGIR